MYPTFRQRNMVNVSTSKTLALTDCGNVQNVISGGSITLPSAAATAPGATFTIRNGGALSSSSLPAGAAADNSLTVTVTANAADSVNGLGFTAANGKGAVNTLGLDGDEITLVTSGAAGANAWTIQNAVGTWTRVP